MFTTHDYFGSGIIIAMTQYCWALVQDGRWAKSRERRDYGSDYSSACSSRHGSSLTPSFIPKTHVTPRSVAAEMREQHQQQAAAAAVGVR